MPFALPEDARAHREAAREFGAAEIEPVAREHDRAGRYPRAVVEAAAERGLVGPTIPTEYGGAGLNALESAVVTEELWRADPGVACAIGNSGFPTNVHLLERHGAEWMREEWFPAIAAGEAADAIAVTEPDHGSDVAAMETTATREGGEWVLDGRKTWISNATVADVAIVFAKTDPDAGHRGISAFLVPTDRAGYEAEPIEGKMGVRAADLGEVSLDGVRVPAENLVGEEDEGFYYFMESLALGRVTVAAQAVGAAQAALDASVAYANEREQFGRPIGEFQAVGHKIADMAASVEAARSLCYRAAARVDADDAAADRFASAAKLFASERAVEVTDDAVQVHGGAGYVSAPVERYYRDARVTKIYEGTSEIQREVIAEDLLG